MIFFLYLLITVKSYIIQDLIVRDQNSSIQLIQTETPQYDIKQYTSQSTDDLIWLFFANGSYTWSDACSATKMPVVWPVAISGLDIVLTGDLQNINRAVSSLKNYRNATAGYSASMAKNGEIYTDDNGQVAWVFTSAYQKTHDDQYINEAKSVIDLIWDYQLDNGGVIWSVGGDYIALISSLEAALAALRYNSLSPNSTYVDKAKKAINYVLDNLIDPNDGFIMDGQYNYGKGGNNTGKLTYTIGVLILGCAYLDKIGDNDKDWKNIAINFGLNFISNGSLSNQFFSSGHMNDIIERTHLVFMGFSDLLELTTPIGNHEMDAYKAFKQLLVRECRNLIDLNPNITNGLCPQGQYGELIKYASLVQSFASTSRVVDMV